MKDLSTVAIHGGEHRRIEGAVTLPIFQSSTYEFQGHESYYDIKYARLNNSPNHLALHEKLALLEGGEAALVLGSGMAAISTAVMALLENGDHIVAHKTLYGASMALFGSELKRFGITCDFGDTHELPTLIRPNTKMIYVESITNPLMEVIDFAAVTELARKHRLLAMIDNTFATPVNFRPLEHGFDVVVHSATKYLNGHSDVVAGCVVGSASLVKKIHHMAVYLGGTLDPHACSLLLRGIKTLVVRVEKQNQSALKLARFLRDQSQVARVHYPGLETHATFQAAQKYFHGAGGMISFELRDAAKVDAFMRRLKVIVQAPSLGGVESLVVLPAKTSHAGLTREQRLKCGVSDGLIRFSVGLEEVSELIRDLEQALAGC